MTSETEQERAMRIKHHDHVVIAVFENCPRCGETHEDLMFERLEVPMDVGGVSFTHWATCPTKTPILLKVETLSA